MRYADVLVGVEYELSDPRGPAPTFEFIQGRLPVLDLGTPWIVIGKQDGWVRVRATYESLALEPRSARWFVSLVSVRTSWRRMVGRS